MQHMTTILISITTSLQPIRDAGFIPGKILLSPAAAVEYQFAKYGEYSELADGETMFGLPVVIDKNRTVGFAFTVDKK